MAADPLSDQALAVHPPLAADACLQRRARRLTGERSRPAYLATGVALLAVAVGVVAGGWHSFTTDTWPSDVYGLIAGVVAWSTVIQRRVLRLLGAG